MTAFLLVFWKKRIKQNTLFAGLHSIVIAEMGLNIETSAFCCLVLK